MKAEFQTSVSHRAGESIALYQRKLSIAFAICAFIVAAAASFTNDPPAREPTALSVVPLGTNQLRVGDKVYVQFDPSRSGLWKVIDPNYRYSDGENGILLQYHDGFAAVRYSKADTIFLVR